MPHTQQTPSTRKATGGGKGKASYVGFVGQKNLGDEVLWQGIKKSFEPLPLHLSRWSAPWSLRRLLTGHRKFDLAILGGGTLIGDNLPDGSNPFREHFEWVAKNSRRRIVFGTGVGALSPDPVKNKWLDSWKPILSQCEYVGVRGPDSVASLRYIGINAEMLGDPAALFAQEPSFWQPREKALGINVGLTPGSPAAQIDHLVSFMSNFVKTKTDEGWKIEFFLVLPDDEQIAQKIKNAAGLPDLPVHLCLWDGKEYLERAGKMRAFVGIKLHSVILAMCAGVPSIMLEYEPKCRDFMKSIDVERFSTKLSSTDPQILNGLMESLMREGPELGKTVCSQMNKMRVRIEERAAGMRELA